MTIQETFALNKFRFRLPPLPTPPPAHAPDRATLLQLGMIILVAVVAHFSIASIEIAVFALTIWAFKLALIYRQRANPPRFMVMLLTILSMAMILIYYGGWNGQKAGISFLVLLVCLKYLESNKLRDYYVVCLILFFLASSSFLFNSSLLNILIVIAYVVFITTLLLRISNPTPSSLTNTAGLAAGILIKALPLAILLFFLFPRIQGNFGFIPSQDELNADNKLDNSLVAGDFASSAFNNTPAFRVKFDGAIPANSQLYWRVKVMVDEHNFQWSVRLPKPEDGLQSNSRQRETSTDQATSSYEIIHQESSDNFAPFLDYVLVQSLGLQLDDHSVYLSKPQEGIFIYHGTSTIGPNLVEDINPNRQQLLNTSSEPTARILALLDNWRREANSNRELVGLVYNYFKNNEFYYSLTPPSLGDNPLDEFLFESMTGYCEHYASAFTILMRWAGIPARIVVGYQGGERNSIGDFLQVRYSDAHAWSEVWLEGQWQRIDPTAAISPERIEYGMDAVMDLWLSDSLGGDATALALANYLNPSGFNEAYRRLRDGWNNIGYQWDKWIVNYDFDLQRELLAQLGFKHKNSLATLLGLLALGTMSLMLFYFWQLIPKAVRIGEAQQIYLRFVTRFKHYKINKYLSETPNEFALRVQDKFPQHTQEIAEITRTYVQLRYGRDADDPAITNSGSQQIKLFRQQVKKFRITPISRQT